jgi:hypothetical protein
MGRGGRAVKYIVQMKHHDAVADAGDGQGEWQQEREWQQQDGLDEQDLSIGDRSQAWVREHRNAGRIDCAYAYPEGGGVGIINANSADEVDALLRTNPGSPYLTWEVRRLVDFD